MSSDTKIPVKRLGKLLSQYKKPIRYIFLYALVAGLINLSLPLGIQAIVGIIAGGSISVSWGVLVFFVILGAMLTGLLLLAQIAVMEFVQRKVFADSAVEFAIRVPRLHMELLRKEHLPELVNRFFDTLTLQKGLPKLLIDGSTAALQIIVSLVVISLYHPSFVLFSVLLIVLLIVLFQITGPRGILTSLAESKQKYKLVYWLEEVGRISTTFQLAGESRYPVRRADRIIGDYLEARERHWRVLLIQLVSSVFFRILVLGGYLILGSLLVMNNQMNLGQFVASEILVLFIVDSVTKLIGLFETYYDVLTATEKIGQVTDLPIEREDGIRVEEFCADDPLEVELRNLSYQYSDGERPTLKNLNMKIEAGERLAISGYNGSGKSTLMQVLSVLKRDFSGALLFNGLPKQNLHLRSLREHIGDLNSHEDIFKGTVAENISLGREKVGLDRLLQVIEQVGLTDFIRSLTYGVNTDLLPEGKNLPKSIITKILVARAIICVPKLLVVEEPLRFLDLRDRIRISKLLVDQSMPWSLVTVTEDPILASLCDRVMVMEEGEFIFNGSFDDLRKTEHYDKVLRVSDNWSTNNDNA